MHWFDTGMRSSTRHRYFTGREVQMFSQDPDSPFHTACNPDVLWSTLLVWPLCQWIYSTIFNQKKEQWTILKEKRDIELIQSPVLLFLLNLLSYIFMQIDRRSVYWKRIATPTHPPTPRAREGSMGERFSIGSCSSWHASLSQYQGHCHREGRAITGRLKQDDQ